MITFVTCNLWMIKTGENKTFTQNGLCEKWMSFASPFFRSYDLVFYCFFFGVASPFRTRENNSDLGFDEVFQEVLGINGGILLAHRRRQFTNICSNIRWTLGKYKAAGTIHWTNFSLTLIQRRRQWPSITLTFYQCFVCAGKLCWLGLCWSHTRKQRPSLLPR